MLTGVWLLVCVVVWRSLILWFCNCVEVFDCWLVLVELHERLEGAGVYVIVYVLLLFVRSSAFFCVIVCMYLFAFVWLCRGAFWCDCFVSICSWKYVCACEFLYVNMYLGQLFVCTAVCDIADDMCALKWFFFFLCKLYIWIVCVVSVCACVCIRRSITDYEGGLSLKRSEALWTTIINSNLYSLCYVCVCE